MPKFFIETSVLIHAHPDKVWNVLTLPEFVHQWAQAFGEGVYPETDWQMGSEVLWKDKEGNTGARGVVATREEHALLRVAYEDVVSGVSPIVAGKYSETYRLLADGNHTFFSLYAGKLTEEDRTHHRPLWDKALAMIKALAEQQ